jgi:hypothetical protein
VGILFFPISYLSEGISLLYPSNAEAARPVVEKATKQLQNVYGNHAFSSTLYYRCCGCLSEKSSNVFVFTVIADTAQHHVPFTPDSERPKQ